MSLILLVKICGAITFLILGGLSYAFWSNPEKGLRQTTHRLENLPLVMADRYAAFAILAAFLTLYGDLNILILFFAVCAFMGFADGRIYARAGHPHWKHTGSGILSVVAAIIALMARFSAG
jgi:hypothetical protein